ncbi:MAG TPA: GcrA family cell cycle regulator [Reyranella sp.]|nr:GcrA family cell cycle regulator [Reyranella sp.]
MEWTEQRIEILRKLWGQGQTASQIAAILGGITRNAVIGKAHRLGLTGRPSPIKREAGASPQPRRRAAAPAARRLPGVGQPGAVHGQPLQTHASAAQHAPAQRAEAHEPVTREAPPPAPKTSTRVATHAGSKTCSWPMGDPKQPGFHFCGEPAEAGKPYCAHHCHVAYHKKSEAA